MDKWLLQRFAYTEKGTFGRLIVSGLDTFYTVEKPWLNNKPRESCIPIGTYTMSRYFSPKRQREVIMLKNDNLLAQGDANGNKRTYIEIHSGNWAKELLGCIAPGTQLNDSWGVMDSRFVMKQLMALVKDGDILEIANATEGGIPL